jgi:hypothetical protein
MVPTEAFRRPIWERPGSSKAQSSLNVPLMKTKQAITLSILEQRAARSDWDAINSDHFDWWLFPVDDGRLPEFNIHSEGEAISLRNDAVWMDKYRKSIEIVSKAMGWDVMKSRPSSDIDGVSWDRISCSNKDVRLAKMIRSTWLLGVRDVFYSLKEFAYFINRVFYSGSGFWYGTICLNEILHMDLPNIAQ